MRNATDAIAKQKHKREKSRKIPLPHGSGSKGMVKPFYMLPVRTARKPVLESTLNMPKQG